MSDSIGLTSTIPIEIVYAAGLRPTDLNNLFINSKGPEKLLRQAEAAGFPPNTCAWIKGIYASVLNGDLKSLIAVTGGDCSNTVALAEILRWRGVKVISFEYPLNRDSRLLREQLDGLRRTLKTTWQEIEVTRERLDRIRGKLKDLDRLTYQENLVRGSENHLYLVTSSDFNSDPDLYERDLDAFLGKVKKRRPLGEAIRLGYLGVPPIFSDLYEAVESLGARVVFNEVQRQFSMPYESQDLVEQYLRYTYPYDIKGRIEDIQEAIEERGLEGLIHYTQTFCYRQLYDIVLREGLSIPILTLEGDRPGKIDARTLNRLETFIEILRSRS
ncbi:MAG: 2-hydroxyacyl-CoA dehydratase [Desulfobacterales bacterium]|nr:2-hydroxyacyl-CoA dehydratase [Desulfobacterales bacterium]